MKGIIQMTTKKSPQSDKTKRLTSTRYVQINIKISPMTTQPPNTAPANVPYTVASSDIAGSTTDATKPHIAQKSAKIAP